MTDTGHISIADALFSKTQQRVLGLLYANPGRSFFTNEVVRQAGGGKGAVTRELSKLLMAGLVTLEQQGNQNHYQANSKNPIFDELCSIAVKTFGVVDVLRDAVKQSFSHIEYACIYGSVAKGTAHAASDIDLLVVSDELGFMELQQQLQPAENTLHRVVNMTLYSSDEFNEKRTSSFLKRILEQPRLVIRDWT